MQQKRGVSWAVSTGDNFPTILSIYLIILNFIFQWSTEPSKASDFARNLAARGTSTLTDDKIKGRDITDEPLVKPTPHFRADRYRRVLSGALLTEQWFDAWPEGKERFLDPGFTDDPHYQTKQVRLIQDLSQALRISFSTVPCYHKYQLLSLTKIFYFSQDLLSFHVISGCRVTGPR